MEKKPDITRTFGPIHFEDLDPHRFEDLIRELVYDFRDWQTIEATGRSGNDEGFDIRGYEKVPRSEEIDEGAAEEAAPSPHPMDGNLWMIQGKREKEIGPKRVRDIMNEIPAKSPPYGYILAASANFSKDSYDAFREELRKKGVMEFHLWGKAELEDMLHQPKNDRILFTFFGVSLVSRRRSRTTEVRAAITIKNKLFRALGEDWRINRDVFLRDLADTHYPVKKRYADFEKRPRWKCYTAKEYSTRGIVVEVRRFFAYVDLEKQEYDFTQAVSLVFRPSMNVDRQREQQAKVDLARGVYDFFPRANQATFCVDGFLEFSNILIMDEKGDVLQKEPHLFVEFQGDNGPISGFSDFFEIDGERLALPDEFKRISVFPEKFEKPKIGTVHAEPIVLDPFTTEQLRKYGIVPVLFAADERYQSLKQRDVVAIAGPGEEVLIQITHAASTTTKKYVMNSPARLGAENAIRHQLGRMPEGEEPLYVCEFKRVYRRELTDT